MSIEQFVCPITGEPSTLERRTDSWFRILSPAAGGKYAITESAYETLHSKPPYSERVGLVSWLMQQRLAGVSVPQISTYTLEEKPWPRRLDVASRLERLYDFLRQHSPTIGHSFPYDVNAQAITSDRWDARATRGYIQAWTESTDQRDVAKLIEYASSKGYVAAHTRLSLTIDGWRHVEELAASSIHSDQAFIAMWFGAEVAEAYEAGIEPAVAGMGYKAMRIDRKEHNNKIDDEIIAEIRRSRFVVADFTCGMADVSGSPTAIPRGGVYYEAGFAQGLGIPVIWCCREDHINHVHFDTRQFNHITWTTAQELRDKLANRIGAVLGDGPHKR